MVEFIFKCLRYLAQLNNQDIGETPEEAIGKLAKIHLVNPIDESLLNDTDENVGLYFFKNVPTVQIKLLPCETTAYQRSEWGLLFLAIEMDKQDLVPTVKCQDCNLCVYFLEGRLGHYIKKQLNKPCGRCEGQNLKFLGTNYDAEFL